MGSDEATVITTPVDLQIGDTVIPAGAYSLDMQPEADGTAKLIFNKDVSRWGIPYTPALQKDELVRVDMKKADAPKELDQFTITLASGTGGAAHTDRRLGKHAVFRRHQAGSEEIKRDRAASLPVASASR